MKTDQGEQPVKHIRPITVAKASGDFGSQFLEVLLADLYNRLLTALLDALFGPPSSEFTSKDT